MDRAPPGDAETCRSDAQMPVFPPDDLKNICQISKKTGQKCTKTGHDDEK